MKHLHYGWVMVIISACVLAIQAAVPFTFGIFLRPLTDWFGWDRGVLSAALSMTMLVGGGLAILTGRLSDKYGPRLLVMATGLAGGMGFLLMTQVSSLWQVYLIWGFLMGVSFSCSVVPVMSTIPRWFARGKGIAMGLAVSGLGLGGLIWPLLAQWLISSYGWQQAYVILGLVNFIIIIPLGQLMKHSPQRVGLKPYGESETTEDKYPPDSAARGLSLTQAIKTSQFWLIGSMFFGVTFSLQVISVHIAPYAVDIGISAIIAASILSIIGGCNLIGRLFIGFICDRVGVRLALTACLAMALLALIWLLFAKEIWMLYLFTVLFGIAGGGIVSLRMLIEAELFGLGSLGIIAGSLLLLSTIGGAIGTPLAGIIFDVTGSYRLAFLLSLILGALAFGLSLILLRLRAGVAVTK